MPAEITPARQNPGKNINAKGRHWISAAGIAAALLLMVNAPGALADVGRESAVQAQIQALLVNSAGESGNTAEERPAAAPAIWIFYVARNYQPAWLNTRRLMELNRLGQLARSHGLNPDEYGLGELAQRIDQMVYTDGVEALAALDLLATERIAQLAADLRLGKVNLSGEKAAPRSATDALLVAGLLSDAAGSESLFNYLQSLPPDTLLYGKLRSSLAQYRDLLARGAEWPVIPAARTLHTGMNDARVPLLRQRLGLAGRETDDEIYDDELAEAVADFQAQHLLKADGLLGRQTVAAMNTSIHDRVDQLRVNLEWQRWAAMPENDEYLLVNVPHYTMHWVRNDERVWSMRTQVGKSKRPTPTFKSSVTAVMANPAWTVPPTIFREDMLPQLQADPAFLQQKMMQVVDGSGQPVDSTKIDWQKTTADDFPYRLRVGPGKQNALGRMKFLMPNPYLIYLHDTPAKHLFDSATRAFSSGCIRIDQPEVLAEFLIDRQPGGSRERLNEALAGEQTRYIGLDRGMPIIVMYATVDLNASGELVFARDLYGKDAQVLIALNAVHEKAVPAPLVTL